MKQPKKKIIYIHIQWQFVLVIIIYVNQMWWTKIMKKKKTKNFYFFIKYFKHTNISIYYSPPKKKNKKELFHPIYIFHRHFTLFIIIFSHTIFNVVVVFHSLPTPNKNLILFFFIYLSFFLSFVLSFLVV